jgi:hypothetical protein
VVGEATGGVPDVVTRCSSRSREGVGRTLDVDLSDPPVIDASVSSLMSLSVSPSSGSSTSANTDRFLVILGRFGIDTILGNP